MTFKLEKGDLVGTVKCCGKHPTVTEWFENEYSWRAGYICKTCGNEGGFGMRKV